MSIRRILAGAAVLITVAAAGNAQSLIDQVTSQLTAQGYSRIEVKRLGTTVKVEAQRDGRELEVVYDSATGAIVKQEVNQIRAGDDTTPGVYVSGRGDDNRSDRSQGRGGRLADGIDDDSSDDDHGDDHGGLRGNDDHRGGRGDRADDDSHDDDRRGGRGDRADDDSNDDDDRGRGRGRGRGGDDD